MDAVPYLFVNEVLSNADGYVPSAISNNLNSPQWALAASGLHRREWRFSVIEENDSLFGIFSTAGAAEGTFLSVEEFARTRTLSNQVTQIDFDIPDHVYAAWDVAPEDEKWTKLSSAKEVDTVIRLVQRRLNFSCISWLNLSLNDSFGLHTAFLDSIVGKNAKIEYFMLCYLNENSLRLLEQQMNMECVVDLTLSGSWDPYRTVDLLKSFVNQDQLTNLVCRTRDTLHFDQDYFNQRLRDWTQQDKSDMSISMKNACLWNRNERSSSGRFILTTEQRIIAQIEIEDNSFHIDLV